MVIYHLASGWQYYRQPATAFLQVFPLRLINLLPFERSAAPGMSYWFRPHTSKTHRPVVFIHGLGIGLIPYVFWLRTIPKDVGIIAVEMLPISGRVTSYPLASTPELCNMIAACLAQQRESEPDGAWNDFVLIGNSYGSLLVAPLLQHPDIAPRVAANIIIDPVALLLHLPDVAYNFTRREPRPSRRGRTGHGSEWEIWWASSTDAGTAHTLARRFCWRESVLWRELLTPSLGDGGSEGAGGNAAARLGKEQFEFGAGPQVGMRSTVVLGGEDCVTHPKAVASYVFGGGVDWTYTDVEAWKSYEWTGREELELMYLDGKDHGQGIMVPRPDKRIAKVIEEYCRRDDGFPGPREGDARAQSDEQGQQF